MNNLDKFVDTRLTLCFKPHLLWNLTKLVRLPKNSYLTQFSWISVPSWERKRKSHRFFLSKTHWLLILSLPATATDLSHFGSWELDLGTIRLRVLKAQPDRNVGCTPCAVSVLIGWAFLWLSLVVPLDLGRVGPFAHSLGTLLRIQQVFPYCQDIYHLSQLKPDKILEKIFFLI